MQVSRVLHNPYEVLGLDRSASEDDIKRAYRRLALQYHPDRNPGDPAAEERFKQATEAYAVLRDPERRTRFDRFGPEARVPDAAGVDWQSIFQEAMQQRGQSAAGFEGVFDPGNPPRTGNPLVDTLFGAVTGMFRQAGLLPGEHRELTMRVPLEQMRNGGRIRVHVAGPCVCATCRGTRLVDGASCPSCQGSGVRKRGAPLDVAVPAGVRNGARLRLAGLGGPGSPAGDVFVTVEAVVPDGVKSVGNDLFVELFLTPLEALNGLRLRLLGVPLEIPAKSRDGQRIRLGGMGLADGDMIVTLKHDVWRGMWRGLRERLIGAR